MCFEWRVGRGLRVDVTVTRTRTRCDPHPLPAMGCATRDDAYAEGSTHDTKGKEKENVSEHWIRKVATKRNPNLDPNPRTNRRMTKMNGYL